METSRPPRSGSASGVLTNKFTDSFGRLRGKDQRLMNGLLIGCVVVASVPGWLFAPWLAGSLGVAMNLPVIRQPHGLRWTLLFLAFMLRSLCACYLVGSAMLTVVLKWGFGWSYTRAYRLMFHAEFPLHWLKPTGLQ